MRKLQLSLLFVVMTIAAGLSQSSLAAAGSALYLDSSVPLDYRVEDLISRMTLEEKIDMVHGHGFDTTAIPRLQIPSIRMTDGPLGVRWQKSTAFPAGVALGATFDSELVGRVAKAIAVEAKAHYRNMLLGPNVNIMRTPFGGRNFEMYSEDPFLTSQLGRSYVRAVQGEGVIASIKHFALNDQETQRMSIDIQADERTMREIYFPPFLAAVKAGVGSVMAAYNKVNGHFSSENDVLIHSVLENEWGFDKFVVSDWDATHSTIEAANAGLDLEMPNGQFFSSRLFEAVHDGRVAEKVVDDKVRRMLRSMFASGLFESHDQTPPSVIDSPEHRALARQAAEEAIVLLKNDGAILPLVNLKKIAVIGPNARNTPLGGGGSSLVNPVKSVDALPGLRNVFGHAIVYNDGSDLADATYLAAHADVALVFVGFHQNDESEGFDRSNMDLPDQEDELIATVAKANPNTVVVITSGTPVKMDWLGSVKAVVQAWYLGEETGTALANVISGQVNPSGKLPVSFPKRWQDASAYGAYPGRRGIIRYSEGNLVGYRHFDTHHVAPLFAFGYGLSYTHFAMASATQDDVKSSSENPDVSISVLVKNTGERAGSETVQLYVAPLNSKAERPVQELKGFQRVNLTPGETARVDFHLSADAFQYWGTSKRAWQVDPGRYEIRIGNSSRNTLVRKTIELK